MRPTLLTLITALGLSVALPAHGSPEEVGCLARNIYFEARGESVEGQYAVAHVTLNRVLDRRWPADVCHVVNQRKQFSWTLRADKTITEPEAYDLARLIARTTIEGVVGDPTDGALYYFDHNTVTPGWSRDLVTTRIIGGHTFLKDPDDE